MIVSWTHLSFSFSVFSFSIFYTHFVRKRLYLLEKADSQFFLYAPIPIISNKSVAALSRIQNGASSTSLRISAYLPMILLFFCIRFCLLGHTSICEFLIFGLLTYFYTIPLSVSLHKSTESIVEWPSEFRTTLL